jgi:4-hydroxy-2-oxoheptanedioate aldolase
MSIGGTVAILADRIAAGQFSTTAWVGMAEPAIAELMVREGFDSAMLDMQHGSVDVTGAIRGIGMVALAGKPCIVRIPVDDFPCASRMLDAGAAAIIAPMINSVEDARRFAAFMKFPPIGERSWGPHRAVALTGLEHGVYLKEANRIQLAIAMIETREALAALDGILAISGIDGVFVGPSDLSIALSNGARLEPHGADVDAALSHVVSQAKHYGKFASAFCFSGARARDLKQRGYSLCSVGTDGLLLKSAIRTELAALHA